MRSCDLVKKDSGQDKDNKDSFADLKIQYYYPDDRNTLKSFVPVCSKCPLFCII